MQFYSGEFIRQIVHKNIGGLITTPFWNYIIISQYGNQIRERKSDKQFCRNLWGHGGSKPLTRILINLLSRLFGILSSCPQALSPEITGAGPGVQTLDANFDKSCVTPVYAILLNGILRQIVHNNQAD